MSKSILFSVMFFLMLGLHFNSKAAESVSISSTSNFHPIAIRYIGDSLVKKKIIVNRQLKNSKIDYAILKVGTIILFGAEVFCATFFALLINVIWIFPLMFFGGIGAILLMLMFYESYTASIINSGIGKDQIVVKEYLGKGKRFIKKYYFALVALILFTAATCIVVFNNQEYGL